MKKLYTRLRKVTLLGTLLLAAVLVTFPAEAWAQQPTNVTVTVTEDDGTTPVVGATVSEVAKAANTVATDNLGMAKISVPADGKLLVRFIGMSPQTVDVAGRQQITVKMASDVVDVEQVVVVGYGTQKKVNMTGAVSVIDGEQLQNRPVVNATQSLQGLVPGLNVSVGNKGGTPGTSYALNIRGQGNLSGSDSPYVLVDGMEMSLADINPNDIENISVLKDASASAIYGARAAYGVILVTTKRGKEGRVSVTYNGNIGIVAPLKLPDMANSLEFAKYFNVGWKNGTGGQEYSDAKMALLEQYVKDPTGMNQWPEQSSNWFGNENSPNGLGNTDYFKFHYKEFALKHDHNVNISGGTDKIQYFVSGGFYNEDGMLRYADINYNRLNLNAKLNAQLAPWAKFNSNIKYTVSNNTTPFGGNAVDEAMFFHNLARFRPTVSPYDANGRFTELSQIPYLQSGSKTDTRNENLGILLGFEFEPVKNWKINFEYNSRVGLTDTDATSLPALIYGMDGTSRYEARTELGVKNGGNYRRDMAKSYYNTFNLFTSYSASINQAHNFNIMVGAQQEDLLYTSLWVNAPGLLNFSNPGIASSTDEKTQGENRYSWATQGVFGRFNYDYKGRYLFEVSARYDGSSRFSAANRWGFFPSASVGWNIAREGFMENAQNVVNNLKLRASWGLLGNQAGAGLYTFAETMGIANQGSWFFEKGRDMYINAPGAFSSTTTWEKIENINLALDYGFFNNRLTGSFEVYQRTTRDMLGPSASFASMYGVGAANTNNAVMRNTGWEFSIQWKGKIGADVSYSVGGHITDYNAEVLAYQNPTMSNPRNEWYVGKQAGEIWGYRADGLLQNQEEADAYNKLDLKYLSGTKWVPGDVKYRDLNGDGKINVGGDKVGDMGDVEVIGNSLPRFQYSINGAISWKGLSLEMLWQGVGKRDYNPGSSVYFYGAGPKAQVTVFNAHLDYWTPENPKAYYPNPYIATVGGIGALTAKTMQSTDRYLQDASYLRLKNLTISYSLPQKWMQAIKFQRASVYFSGENLVTFTNLASMFDPETVFVFGEGGKNYALNQVFSFGLNITL